MNKYFSLFSGLLTMSGKKCAKCGKPMSYGNIYCKACGGTGIQKLC